MRSADSSPVHEEACWKRRGKSSAGGSPCWPAVLGFTLALCDLGFCNCLEVVGSAIQLVARVEESWPTQLVVLFCGYLL